MTASAHRVHRSVFLLTTGLLFATTALRSVISPSVEEHQTEVLLMLAAWLALLVLDVLVAPRWPSFCPVALAAQTLILYLLMARVWHGDVYAVLFGVMSMRAMERLGWKTTALWIVLFAPLTALALSASYELGESISFAVTYAVLDAFFALFALITVRAEDARARNEELGVELAAANREVEASAQRIERLASAEERHRLARELHDSVTQTVFSMNLTAQSAALLLTRDRHAATEQLDRLEGLARAALAEIRALDEQLADGEEPGDEGLESALRRHLAGRPWPDGLSVALAVEGATGGSRGQSPPGLSEVEEHALFRIAQEALNNVVKHARARQADVRLRLVPPRRLEISDDGRGFDPDAAPAQGMGLSGMGERAVEIDWRLEIDTAPGAGTRIVVEEAAGGDAIGTHEERTAR